MFVNLMENGYDKNAKSCKYIQQIADKFEFFRRRSPTTYFDIDKKDLSAETIKQLEDYTKDCKTTGERYRKLNGPFTEVIAWIAIQAESRIMSSKMEVDTVWIKKSIHEIRELVSFRWRLTDDGDKEGEGEKKND